MRIPIETNRKFVLRLEDLIYLLTSLYLLPIGILTYHIFWFNHRIGIQLSTILTIFGLCLAISILMIFLAYRNRIQNLYYLEDETIIKERNGKEIFRIPFKKIVSVRVNNKKGTQGTIIFFTNPRSKSFKFSNSNSEFKLSISNCF